MLELQFVHIKTKPAKDYSPEFPPYHKDYTKMIISQFYQVYDSVENPTAIQGDPFLYSLGVSADY